MKIANFEKATDEELLTEVMYWIRVGRNEDGLIGEEKSYFKNLSNEVNKRRLLSHRPTGT